MSASLWGLFLALPLCGNASATVPLGVNLEDIQDYARSQMFVDAMKMSRVGWGQPDEPWSASVPLDADGWPTTDAGVCVITKLPNMDGTYKLSFSGKADISTVASPATIENVVYDAASQTTTADVVVRGAGRAANLYLGFRNTNGGVRNVQLLRPGYPRGTKEVFTRPFLESLKPFGVIRLMDYLRTNMTTVSKWPGRARLSDATQATGKGGAWEYAIQLANQAGKDLWINVPDQADDDYVRQLATLLKATLRPDRVVYVEYSNEVWNFLFEQANRNLATAKAEVAAGQSNLNYDGTTNEYYWAWRRVAQQLIRIGGIFRQVYGNAALNTTVRPVLASQIGSPSVLRQQIEYIARVFGPPTNYIYAVAGAPYFGLGRRLSSDPTLTVDRALAATEAAVGDALHGILIYDFFANHYGVRHFSYEGGPDLTGEIASDVKLAACRDTRMGSLIARYLRGWYASGGELFMYFNLSGSYSKSGCWGLTEDITQPSYKTRAIETVLSEPLPAVTAGVRIPAEIPATDYLQSQGGNIESDAGGGKDIGSIEIGSTFDYLLNAGAGASYTIRLKVASVRGGGRVRVLVDGREAGVVDVASTGGWHTWAYSARVNVYLGEGLHSLRLAALQSGFNLKAVQIDR